MDRNWWSLGWLLSGNNGNDAKYTHCLFWSLTQLQCCPVLHVPSVTASSLWLFWRCQQRSDMFSEMLHQTHVFQTPAAHLEIRRWHWGKGSSPEAPQSYPSKVGFFCPLVATNGTSAALFILVFYSVFFPIHYNNLLNLWKKATTKQLLTDYPEG